MGVVNWLRAVTRLCGATNRDAMLILIWKSTRHSARVTWGMARGQNFQRRSPSSFGHSLFRFVVATRCVCQGDLAMTVRKKTVIGGQLRVIVETSRTEQWPWSHSATTKDVKGYLILVDPAAPEQWRSDRTFLARFGTCRNHDRN